MTTSHTSASTFRRAVVGTLAAFALLPATALAEPSPVTAPAIPGTPALAGPVVDAGKPATATQLLKVSPDVAKAGTAITVTGTGLAPNKDVSLVWMTANIRYVLDAKPDSVDYIGRKVDKVAIRLAQATTNASGGFTAKLVAPNDFGGLHDLYAVVDGLQVAKGGFLLERQVSISPKRGPIGTTITVTVLGMGSPTYESVGSVLYDNRYTGAVAANTTRGKAVFKLRASGEPGKHWIEYAGSSHTVPYLNMIQSPVPWTDSHRMAFTITKDAGAPKPTLEWPAKVEPTIVQRTTLQAASLTVTTAAKAELSTTSGAVLSKVDLKASGLTPGAQVDVAWSTVVGNRVNCTGQCWNFVSVPLGKATALPDGTVALPVTVPDGLGGWHVIQVSQGTEVKAQVPFFVKRSFVQMPKVVKAGQPFTIQIKGVGWTQLDNTVAVTYDNGYIGYACGFNSNGDVQIQMFATGAPGTHLIDLYPLLYTQQPAYPYPQLGMVPLLSFASDAPGLAAGYQLPAFRLAITVVK